MSIKRSLLIVSALLGLCIVLLSPFIQPGAAYSDDILVTIYRVFALRQSWEVGIFYPRIAPDLAFGYGAPLFQFYPPLSSYIAALFALVGIGVVDAVKLTFGVTLFVGGVGTYLYARDWFKSAAAGWLAALVFVAAPYQLANIYIRGATAEALGLALFPWILWSEHRLLRSDRPLRWLAWFTLLLAALLISHNALSLFFLPILIVACLLDGWQQRKFVRLAWCGGGVLLALGMSAFFWLPAVVEKDQVNIAAMVAGHYDPLNHLQGLLATLQHAWLFDYQRPQVYTFGWLPLVVSLLAVPLLLWRSQERRVWNLLALLLLIGCLLLQLPSAAFFWRDLPLVRFIQFPWRLFAFATLATALLIGGIPTLVRKQPRLTWGVTGFLSLLIVGYGFFNLPDNYAAELAQGNFGNDNVNHRDLYERGRLGFELFSDYQPLTMHLPMAELPNSPSAAPTIDAGPNHLPDITLQQYAGLTLHATIQSQQPAQLVLNRLFLPGWSARVNGVPTAVTPVADLGLAALEVPAGSSDLTVEWGQTPIRTWADRLSLLSVAVWIGLFLLGWQMRKRTVIIGAVVSMLLLLPLAEAPFGSVLAWQQTVYPIQAQVGDFADLLGYALDKASYKAGETIQLTLFWRCRQPLTTEYKVFVHLRDLADTQMAGQHDGAPVYGFTPTTRWLPGELIDDTHPLAIDSSVPPGTYQLAIGMYDPNTVTNLPVHAEKTLPGERIVLGTVVVQ